MGRLAGVKAEVPSSNITGRLTEPAIENRRQPPLARPKGVACVGKPETLASRLHTLAKRGGDVQTPEPRTTATRSRSSSTCRVGHGARDLRPPLQIWSPSLADLDLPRFWLPSPTIFPAMASDPPGSSPASSKSESVQPSKEDAETTATRKELRNTSISGSNNDAPRSGTPEVPEEKIASGDQVSSPKKKRGHDQLEDDPAATSSSLNVCVFSSWEDTP